MTSIRYTVFFIFIFLFYSCGPSLESAFDFDYPLSNKRISSRINNLTLKIPEGWFSVEDNEKNILDIWMVKDDYSATIGLVPLNYHDNSKSENAYEEVKKLIGYSKYFKRIESKDTLKESGEEVFEINNRLFGAYLVKSPKNFSERIVVFNYRDTSFELTARCEKPELCDSTAVVELYRIQNSVLTSITE